MKKIILTLVFTTISLVGFSQIDYYEQPDNKLDTSVLFRKYLYGLDFGFTLGAPTKIMLSPKIAYPVLPWFTVGSGADGLYYSYAGFSAFMYGGNIFTDFFAFRIINFHLEMSKMNVETFANPNTTDRQWNTAMYVGGGYRQMISDKAYISYLVLWDFNYSDITPYSNPTFRFTFYF